MNPHAPTSSKRLLDVAETAIGGMHEERCIASDNCTCDVEQEALRALGGKVAGYEEFVAWLLSMDDPENPAGLEERRSVTLTRIIEKARAL